MPGDHIHQQDNRRLTAGIFQAALAAVEPYSLVEREFGRLAAVCRSGGYGRLLVLGFGKAAYPMAKAIADRDSGPDSSGIVITKYGHLGDVPLSGDFHCFEAGHPVPDANGLAATGEVLRALRGADARTLVVCLVSGGGSALLAAPLEGITLGEMQQLTDALLKAGADIRELNTVRKHISRVKGGRLAAAAYPAGVLSLILSDVIGDRLDVIASGPTAPDGTTYRDAMAVIERYRLWDRISPAVVSVLERGTRCEIPETPKAEDPVFDRVENVIIGSNQKAVEAAAVEAEASGYKTEIVTTTLQGEACEAGRWLARRALKVRRSVSGVPEKKVCLLSGGETTVTVRGEGRGGRNMEMALAFALAVDGVPGVTFLSAGTDGTDGPTDAAGAIVDGGTVKRAAEAGMVAAEYLKNNDSYTFFKASDGLLMTGPTGTNVMDLQIILIE